MSRDPSDRRRRRSRSTVPVDGPPEGRVTTTREQVEELPRRLLDQRAGARDLAVPVVPPAAASDQRAVQVRDRGDLVDAEQIRAMSREELLRAVAVAQADLAVPLIRSTADLSTDELRGLYRGLCQVTGRWREAP